MKLLKVLIPAGIIVAIFALTAPINSCTKTKYVHDTTTVAVHDTTRDTTIIRDTVGCCNVNEDMVAYYTFTGGSLKDSSGHHNDIVFNNATTTTDRNGVAGGAYLFNGTSSYMRVAHDTSLNPSAITLMAVVKFNDFYRGSCHGNQLIMKGTPDQSQGVYSLRVIDFASNCSDPADTSKEKVTGMFGDYPQLAYASDSASGSYIKAAKWYTFIYTYDGTVSRIYVNGVLKGTIAGTAIVHPNTNDLFIGQSNNPAAPFWVNGVIDEVRIYKKALCPSAIATLSKSTVTGQ